MFGGVDLLQKFTEIGWMSYIGYIACIAVLGMYLLFLYVGVEAHHFDFIERDPALSLPLLTEHFSCNTVTVISICFPVITLLSILLRPYNKRHQANMPTLRFGLWMYLGLALAMLSTYCLTNTIKLAVGMPRPNCFAMCDYQGYNEAVITNDFTVYDDLTVAGAFGKRANCLSSSSFYKAEAFLSFPSGHASIISADASFRPSRVGTCGGSGRGYICNSCHRLLASHWGCVGGCPGWYGLFGILVPFHNGSNKKAGSDVWNRCRVRC